MAPTDHNHAITVFPKVYSIEVLHDRRICRPFPVHGRGKEHCVYAARIVVILVPGLLGQRAVVCFINVAQKVIARHDLINPRVDFHVQTVVQTQAVNLNGLCNVIRHELVILK